MSLVTKNCLCLNTAPLCGTTPTPSGFSHVDDECGHGCFTGSHNCCCQETSTCSGAGLATHGAPGTNCSCYPGYWGDQCEKQGNCMQTACHAPGDAPQCPLGSKPSGEGTWKAGGLPTQAWYVQGQFMAQCAEGQVRTLCCSESPQ